MMNKIKIYPVWFKVLENEKVLAENLDFPVYTEGENLEEAVTMVKDALELMIYEYTERKIELPKPNYKQKNEEYDFMALVDCDTEKYKKIFDKKKVKKNLTIPRGIAELGEQAGINFSELLTKSLKKELGI